MLAIFYAIEQEIIGLYSALSQREQISHRWAKIERGVFEGSSVILVKSGAGKVLSAMTAQSIIDLFRPSAVALCGISGALNPNYAGGDLVLGAEFIQHDISTDYFGFAPGQVPFTDYRIIPADSVLLEHASNLVLEGAKIHRGRIASGDQFISGTRGRSIRQQFGADLVDMESAAVAFVCHLNRIPLVVARTISDQADETAAQDFGDFLPRASLHVTAFIRHILLA